MPRARPHAGAHTPSTVLVTVAQQHNLPRVLQACQKFRARHLGIGESRLGRYRLGEVLGAGGMGVVIDAVDEELQRHVAIKLFRTGKVAADDGLRMLRREARALARLSDPRIVDVYDFGVLDSSAEIGLPLDGIECNAYMVMARVRGEPLRVDAKRSWPEVRRLFCEVAQALDRAHSAGVTHGDIKPANVLVASDGTPTIVDFGFARLAATQRVTAPISTDSTTKDMQVSTSISGAGTPVYMAPELLAGGGATPATDQYAACVMLFALIHGRLPFPQGRLPDLYRAKTTLDVDWSAPTMRIPATVRAAIARGLRANPARRFASMQALSEAVREHRHRGPRRVALGAAILLGGALGLGSVDSVPPAAAEGVGAEILHRVANNLLVSRTGGHRCEDDLDQLAVAHHDSSAMGLNAAAAALALDLAEQIRLCTDDTSRARHWLREAEARIARGSVYADARFRARWIRVRMDEEPTAVRRDVLEQRLQELNATRTKPGLRDAWAEVVSNLAILYAHASNRAGAVQLAREAVSAMTDDWGPDDRRTANAREGLAHVHMYRGEEQLALAEMRAVVAVQERILGPSHRDTLRNKGNEATMLWRTGDDQAALAAFGGLLAPLRETFGPDHKFTINYTVNAALAHTAIGEKTGDLDTVRRGEEMLRRALVSDEVAESVRDERVATRLIILGLNLRIQGRIREALAVLDRAIAGLGTAPDAQLDVANARQEQARALYAAGDGQRAAALLEKILADTSRARSQEAEDLRDDCWMLLAAVSAELGDAARARHALAETKPGRAPDERAAAEAAIASAEGRHGDAAALYRIALDAFADGPPFDHAFLLARAAGNAATIGDRALAVRMRRAAAETCARVQAPGAQTCAPLMARRTARRRR